MYLASDVYLVFLSFSYSYVFVIQPWLCWRLWNLWYLKPLVIYVSSIYSFYFVLSFVISTSMFLFILEKEEKGIERLRSVQFFVLRLYANIFHGYELHGIENLPKKGGLIIGYQGLLVADVFFMITEVQKKIGKRISAVSDFKAAFLNFPLCKNFAKLHNLLPRKSWPLVETALNEGELVWISPGGTYEANFSENYELQWRDSCGFARICKETGAPAIPMFTANIREYTNSVDFGFKDLFKYLYLRVGIPFYFPSRGLPVKLRTYFGAPLCCRNGELPEEFALRVKAAIQELRDKHQRIPGSVVGALIERLGIQKQINEN